LSSAFGSANKGILENLLGLAPIGAAFLERKIIVFLLG